MPVPPVSVAIITASSLSIMATMTLSSVTFTAIPPVYSITPVSVTISIIPMTAISLPIFVFLPTFFSVSARFARMTLALPVPVAVLAVVVEGVISVGVRARARRRRVAVLVRPRSICHGCSPEPILQAHSGVRWRRRRSGRGCSAVQL